MFGDLMSYNRLLFDSGSACNLRQEIAVRKASLLGEKAKSSWEEASAAGVKFKNSSYISLHPNISQLYYYSCIPTG